MSYIWENYSEENYYFVQNKNQSYYEEVWKKYGNDIPVNLYRRFTELFFPAKLCGNVEIFKRLAYRYKNDGRFQDIVNVFLHQLCYFDRLRGITSEDLEMALVYDEISRGLYGVDTIDAVRSLKFDDLYIILKELVKLSRSKQRENLFGEALHLLFGKVIIYYDHSSDKTLVYIEQIRNAYREKLYQLAVFLFADLDIQQEIYWANEHFGIIENNSTMVIGKIKIY